MVHKNARIELRKYEFERRSFTAEFIKFGHAANNKITTVLLQDVKDEFGVIVASHMWLNRAKPFYDAKVVNGDVVQFTGLVMRYRKGTYGVITDFTICFPLNVKNVSDKIEYKVQY